jgi:hypothetical protein
VHDQRAIDDPQRKKPNEQQANHVRGDTKLTALISVATPPTEFKEPKGA